MTNPLEPPSSPITTPVLIPFAKAGVRHTNLLDGLPQTHVLRSGQITLIPGDSVSLHSTQEGEELIIPLSGRGQLNGPGMDRLPVEPGGMLFIPPQTWHTVVNTGDEPLVYVYVYGIIPKEAE